MYFTKKKTYSPANLKIRFFKPVTAYLVNIHEYYVIFNVYYKTTLEAFQSLQKKKQENVLLFNVKDVNEHILKKCFYL